MQLIFDQQKHPESSPFRRNPTRMEWVLCAAFLVMVTAVVLILTLHPTRTDIKIDQTTRVLPMDAQIEINASDPSGRQWSWSLQPEY